MRLSKVRREPETTSSATAATAASTLTRRQHQRIEAVTGLLAHETTSPGLPDDYVALVRTALAELLEATGLETVYLTRVNVEDGEQERRHPPARADHLCLGAHPAAQRGPRRHAVRRGVDAAPLHPDAYTLIEVFARP